MRQQDFDKQLRRIEDFAELNEVPIDHFLYQQMAQAARSFREGEFEKAQFQLDDALAAAQDFGTSPQDYLPQTSISETITLTESQLRRVIREALSRFGDVRNFIQTVIWPCYQDGMSERECYRNALGVEEMQFLRKHKEDILTVNDNPEFIAYAYEVACMV